MVESMKEDVESKRKVVADFFEIMGDSSVYESEYLNFDWYIGGVQGVIPVVPHILGYVPQFPD